MFAVTLNAESYKAHKIVFDKNAPTSGEELYITEVLFSA